MPAKIPRPSSSFRVDRNKYQIHIPLPPKIDPTVTMMQVENSHKLFSICCDAILMTLCAAAGGGEA